jgi:type II secretory pathway pseudopilin PulG
MVIFWQASAKRAQHLQPQHSMDGQVRRAGFTLVEMLIAMGLTLIMVVAIAEFYGYVGTTVKDGRAAIEMSGQVSNAASWLKSDLDQITVPVRPAADDGSGHGYLEVGEGLGYDLDPQNGTTIASTVDTDGDGIPDYISTANVSNLRGDTDDYLAFTIRSKGQSLVGQHLAIQGDPTSLISIASTLAEVVWYTGFTDENGDGDWDVGEETFLYRRQLLIIAPNSAIQQIWGDYANIADAQTALRQYWQSSDISASIRTFDLGGGTFVFRIIPNSLVDVTRREHRFAHQNLPGNFPSPMLLNARLSAGTALGTGVASFSEFSYQGPNLGEDRLLSQLLAFDVRVFDPTAPVRADNSDATGLGTPGDATDDAVGKIQPGDPGWTEAVANSYPFVGAGAYVDLGYNRYLVAPGVTSQFSAAPAAHPALPAAAATLHQTTLGYTYDTWATSYERDGYSQRGAPGDLATNGVDDLVGGVTNGLVDDPLERDTVPPYGFPLRGLQVKIRVYEPGTRQMRQATIVADFIHE